MGSNLRRDRRQNGEKPHNHVVGSQHVAKVLLGENRAFRQWQRQEVGRRDDDGAVAAAVGEGADHFTGGSEEHGGCIRFDGAFEALASGAAGEGEDDALECDGEGVRDIGFVAGALFDG